MQQTFKFKIKHIYDNNNLLDDYIYQYTGLFYKLYNNFELSQDKLFIDDCLEQYPLICKVVYEYCVIDVKSNIDSFKEHKKEKLLRIDNIDKQLMELEKIKKLTKKQKRRKEKLLKKKAFLTRIINKDICFGGKDILRRITKYKQLGNKITNKQQLILDRLLIEYKGNRKRNLFLVGNTLEKGSRKMNFHLIDNYVVFKINKHNHIKISLVEFDSKKRKEIIIRLQQCLENKLIPITVVLNKNELSLTFDNEILNGFGFDTVGYNYDRKTQDNGVYNKELKIKYHNKQTETKLKGKISNRSASVDMNPERIGFSIIDVDMETFEVSNIVFTKRYELSKLTEKKRHKTTKTYKKYINNKLKHEISQIYKEIFEYCKHYKVGYFALEDLKFLNKEQVKSVEFNRKTKTVWNRVLQEQLCQKYCGELGVIFDYVDCQYTSFIGNMLYYDAGYSDCVSASIEISRRILSKYQKGLIRLYPVISSSAKQRMSHLLGVKVDKLKDNWVALQKQVTKTYKDREGGWRNHNNNGIKVVDNNLNHTNNSLVTYQMV